MNILIECLEGNVQNVEYLLNTGVNVNMMNDICIRNASSRGHFELVKLLVLKGANIHVYNDECILIACMKGYIDIVKFLYTKGISVYILNCCLQKASSSGNIEVVQFLYDRGVDIHINNDYCFLLSSYYNYTSVVDFIISQGVNIEKGYVYNKDIVAFKNQIHKFHLHSKVLQKCQYIPIKILDLLCDYIYATM